MSHHNAASGADAGTGRPGRAAQAALDLTSTDPRKGGIRIPAGGSHRVSGLSESGKLKLLAAVMELKPEKGASLAVLGVDVAGLDAADRAGLRARIGFLPAQGGLLSNLNAWENITLPLGIHRPGGLRDAAGKVDRLLSELGTAPGSLLAKLPERMSLYEKKLTAYVRILLEEPELVLVEDLGSGLSAAEQAAAAGFDTVYHAHCPGGTFVRLETVPGT
jgi:ABC-type lipoprotein export system ATPase subunit